MRAVMYHYVRGETDRPPAGYYHLDVDDFRAQLDYLEREHTLLSAEQFRACLHGERVPDDAAVLTFDDGLADHYECVLPELRRRGLWGLFFVPTAPLVFGRRLPVQRIHTLVSEYPGSELLDELERLLDGEDVALRTDRESMYADRDTESDVRRFKHLLNRAVPTRAVSSVLDRLEAAFPAADVAVDDVYLTPAQLRELADAGMGIGAHSVTHAVLADLPRAAQQWEIRASRRQLADLLGRPVDLFAYPYGGPESYTAETVRLVREAGFSAAFTTVDGDVGDGALTEPTTLPRRDCADLPHGDSTVTLPAGD